MFLSCCLTIALVGWRNAVSPSRLIGWYIFVFLLTYLLRPLATLFTGDNWLYRYLGMASFEDSWHLLAMGVALALVGLGVGYLGARTVRWRSPSPPKTIRRPEASPKTVATVSCMLIAIGYASLFLAPQVSTTKDVATYYAIHPESSVWLVAPRLFVTTGATLLVIKSGKLWLGLAVAVPWLITKIGSGFGRIEIIGFFFALLAVGLVRREPSGEKSRNIQKIALGLCLALVVLVLFPGTKQKRDFFTERSTSAGVAEALRLNLEPKIWATTTSDIMGFETSLYQLQSSRGLAWGTYYAYYFLIQPIPRALWPGKPLPSTMAEDWFGVPPDRRLLAINFPLGAIGVAHQQWGWPGIFFEFLFVGWLFAILERLVQKRKNEPHILLSYAGFFSLLPQIARDGLPYMIADRWLLAYGAPVVLLMILRHSPASLPSAPAWATKVQRPMVKGGEFDQNSSSL